MKQKKTVKTDQVSKPKINPVKDRLHPFDLQVGFYQDDEDDLMYFKSQYEHSADYCYFN
jgi:hypothetical protein